MRKFLLGLALLCGLASPSGAVDSYTAVGNAAYTILATDTRLVPTVAISANRTWTLPAAAATCIGQSCPVSALEVVDYLGNVGGANSCILFAPASGETLNGSASSVTFCSTYGRVILVPLSGSAWFAQVVGPGQLSGTTTNDSAQVGFTGEVLTSGLCPGTGATATVTITIATPGVITWATHGMTGACPVVLTTNGALPTGLTASTVYWTIPSSITTNTFQLATTVANALAGTAIATSGTQSGTQTGTGGLVLSSGAAGNVTGLALTAGDWDCRAKVSHNLGASTSVTILSGSISVTSATAATRGTDGETLLATAANVMGVNGTDLSVGPFRVSLSATTNYFLVAQDTFSVSTDGAYGSLTCRRAR